MELELLLYVVVARASLAANICCKAIKRVGQSVCLTEAVFPLEKSVIQLVPTIIYSHKTSILALFWDIVEEKWKPLVKPTTFPNKALE